ncbi:hypothetical protein A3K80_00500 [Candidatus Bathyarchaeota archaeon RBG_13_38_9]|nr:MAG: hypothetical protein A3K80_00500 [Candidatus Bathyarchaeota archaeon RBG_13_38_9]
MNSSLKYKEQNRIHRRENALKNQAKIRLEVSKHYGHKCACCGESNINFLTIHHINGRNKDCKEDKYSGVHGWRWLKENNYPPGYQLLCWNCNCSLKNHKKEFCPVHHPEIYNFSLPPKKSHYFRFQQVGFQRRRNEVIMHYGNKCNCCDEKRKDFLTIDHIEQPHKVGIHLYGERLYRYIIRNNFPEGFQVLCWNCNCLKGKLNVKLCYVHHPELYTIKPETILEKEDVI